MAVHHTEQVNTFQKPSLHDVGSVAFAVRNACVRRSHLTLRAASYTNVRSEWQHALFDKSVRSQMRGTQRYIGIRCLANENTGLHHCGPHIC